VNSYQTLTQSRHLDCALLWIESVNVTGCWFTFNAASWVQVDLTTQSAALIVHRFFSHSCAWRPLDESAQQRLLWSIPRNAIHTCSQQSITELRAKINAQSNWVTQQKKS